MRRFTMNSSNGFTIVEMAVAMGIASALLVTITMVMANALPLYRSTFIQASANETARVQLRRLSHTIRAARPSDAGSFPIVEALPARLVFYANVDSDAATEMVRYEKVGTDLVRGITQPSGNPVVYDTAQETITTIARHIENGANPVFMYYGNAYPEDATPVPSDSLPDVTYISFSLTIDADTVNEPQAVTVQSQVQLRNLKTNL